MNSPQSKQLSPWREALHKIIFEANTFGGVLFDVTLLVAILLSVFAIAIETVSLPDPSSSGSNFFSQFADYPSVLSAAKEQGQKPRVADLQIVSQIRWFFTILFTIEYLLRIICVRRPLRYIFSFWGIIDLLSFLPEYFLLGMPWVKGASSFSVLRALRLLRVFRIFKLTWMQNEAEDLGNAVYRSRAKILVFLTVVLIVVTVAGTVIYEVESSLATSEKPSQFDSIPDGIYWAIVTMTTVGFGDIVPVTVVGKIVSACLILLGYSLIIVPTGFVSAEIIDAKRKEVTTISCSSCITEGHDADAIYCKYCGERL